MNKDTALIIGFVILLVVGLIPVGIGALMVTSSDKDELAIRRLGVNYAVRALILSTLVIPFFVVFKEKRTIVTIILVVGEFANLTLFKLRK